VGWYRQRVQISLVGWTKICSPISKGGLGSKIYSCLNELSWGSGYGTMLLRERLCRKWQSILYMGTLILNISCGLGGVLIKLVDRMGLVSQKISRGIEGSFLDILVLWWEMVLMLDFGITCGVGT
jgi:hypothetical protein